MYGHSSALASPYGHGYGHGSPGAGAAYSYGYGLPHGHGHGHGADAYGHGSSGYGSGNMGSNGGGGGMGGHAFGHHPPAHSTGGHGHVVHSGPYGRGREDPTAEILRISPDTLSQLELMLESVAHRAAATTIAAVELSRTLQVKQDLLELQQSNLRNYLLSVSLRMSMVGVAVSMATFTTSVFGMNLATGIEEVPIALPVVTCLSLLMGGILYRAIDKTVTSSSPTVKHSKRLEAFQQFLYKLDANLDAAKDTLEAAAASGRSTGSAAGAGATGTARWRRLVTNEFAAGEDDAQQLPGGRLAGATVGAGSGASVDGSVNLTKAEFRAMHERNSGTPISDEEVDLLFELLDADGDGRLRLSEVMGLYERTAEGRV